MKKILITVIFFMAVLSFKSHVLAAESHKGYITGHLCGEHAMICPPEHQESGAEHVVFITEDGRAASWFDLKSDRANMPQIS